MEAQAEEVMLLMLENPEIDYWNDWKMITLFIGGNDLCQYCNEAMNVRTSSFVYFTQCGAFTMTLAERHF